MSKQENIGKNDVKKPVKSRKVKEYEDTLRDYLDNDYCDARLGEVEKPYVQFSKKMIVFCIVNLLIIEIFVMVMVVITNDTSVLPYFITSLCVQFLGVGVWYLKNSEAEKRARIDAEVERMKMQGKVPKEAFDKMLSDVNELIEAEPETYYKEDSGMYTDFVKPIDSFESSNNVGGEDDEAVG